MSGVRTLEGAAGDDFWSAYEAIMGGDGLMTYRYIGSSGVDGRRSAPLDVDRSGPS